MKYKTRELTGGRLDQAVAKACGYIYDKNISEDFIVTSLNQTIPPRPPEVVHREVCRVVIDGQERSFCPSSEWVHGGPIIERERISVMASTLSMWDAVVNGFHSIEGGMTHGIDGAMAEDAPTPLVAAMRAFVAHKLGDEVDL